jgi:hypothetical protein
MSTQVLGQSADTMTIKAGGRGVMLVPTFQRGYVPNAIDGFRFTLVVAGAYQMPSKIFRYRLVPTKLQPVADQPPAGVEYKGYFDGVCSPADLEDFPEDYPVQNARPPWFRLDYVDVIVRSRSIAEQAYDAILFEVKNLIETLEAMDRQETAPPIFVGATGS